MGPSIIFGFITLKLTYLFAACLNALRNSNFFFFDSLCSKPILKNELVSLNVKIFTIHYHESQNAIHLCLSNICI